MRADLLSSPFIPRIRCLPSGRLFSLLLCALLLFSSPVFAREQSLPAAEETESQEGGLSLEEVEDFARELLTGDASLLDGKYPLTPEMEKALASAGGMAGLQKSLSSLGKLVDRKEAYLTSDSGMSAWHIPCVFEAVSVDLILYLDEESRIAGLVTGAYTGNLLEEDGLRKKELDLPVAEIEGGELPGVLSLPEGEGPFPVVILVHGSGPNDRNESVGPNAPFLDMAKALAGAGVAVYRYDKRTYVYNREIAGDLDFTLYEETVEDAATAVRLLAQQEEIDPGRIFVAGHSLGGMALPAIRKDLSEAPVQPAGYVFLAAPARDLPTIMREQYDFLYSLIPKLSFTQRLEKNQIMKELDKLSDPAALPPDEPVLGAYPAYWADLASYDPLQAAKEITEPCLVLQGEEDYQVTMEDFSLWQAAFEEAENWEFLSFPGLTHLFLPGLKTEGPDAYLEKKQVAAEVTEAMADFILGR